MIRNSKLLTLIFLMLSLGCNNQEDKAKSNISDSNIECKPYFTYDEVEHFYFDISEEEIMKIEEKEKKTDVEAKQIELLIQYTPDKLCNTTSLKDIDKIGYVKQVIPQGKFEQLNKIFCERKHTESLTMACIAIYRDILIFKKSNKIVGTAKICFECGQSIITGTARSTQEFGQSGDYDRLFKLLN